MINILQELKPVKNKSEMAKILNKWSGYPWDKCGQCSFVASEYSSEREFVYYDFAINKFYSSEHGIDVLTPDQVLRWLKKNFRMVNFK